MKLRYFLRIIVVLGLAIASLSCKKDKKEKPLPALNGKVAFDFPEFVEPGQMVQSKISGVTHPKNEAIGYYFYIPQLPKEIQRDTVKALDSYLNRVFKMTFPTDTVGTYTINGYAFATGYQSTSTTRYCTLVNSDLKSEYSSIKYPGSGSGTTERLTTELNIDGVTHTYSADYFITDINGAQWLANNVHNPHLGKPFAKAGPMSKIFGNYYNYEEATKVCPVGWKLPTEEDFNNLTSYVQSQIDGKAYKAQTVIGALVADATFNSHTMWEYWSIAQGGFGKITNETGLSILSTGYCNLLEEKWEGAYQYAAFWIESSDESAKKANVFYIESKTKDILFNPMDKQSFGANVRCIRK